MSLTTSVSSITPSRLLKSRSSPEASPCVAGVGHTENIVANQLLEFFCVPGLRYRERPTPLTGGWETYTYGLEFEPHSDLPARFCGPLVLRIYANGRGKPRARHEFAVQEFINRHGFPSARPLLLVDDQEPFGAPFLLMERLPGESLLTALVRQPWRLWDLPGQMGKLHARLHQLSPEGFPGVAEDFLERSLNEIRACVVTYSLEGLRPGLEWLTANRPSRTGTPRPLHLDWHPLNLILFGNNLSVLDWTEADVGDRHADVATTLMALLCYPMPPPRWWHRPFVPMARALLARWYLQAYRNRMPIDGPRLTYFSARAALARLAHYGRWLSVGPGSVGCKPTALRHICPAHCEAICQYFTRYTGIEVKLDCEGW